MTIALPTPHATAVRRDLHEGWSVRAVAGPVPTHLQGRSFPATVPGSVHTDLLAAGAIDDPYLDDNEALQRWIGLCDWEYRSAFAWSAGATPGARRHELVLEGVDTVAVIELNGSEVARTANMHRTYRIDVTTLLRDDERGEGLNELVVRFSSPVRYADAQSLVLGYRPQVNHHPFNAIRKMACSFGWDWGIDTATSGLWRPVRLESWGVARVASVRPVVGVTLGPDRADGHVDVHVALARSSSTDVEVVVALERSGRTSTARALARAGVDELVVPLDVEDVALWWPRGHGGQPLYDLRVDLVADDVPVDRWVGRTGFRDARLDVTPDEQGTSFRFVVNGEPVWVRGANWIPDDAFPHRVTRERYAARLAQAQAANLNLLRVWGGGIYEADDFYDLCDEAGILTWQDFALSCAAYSEDEPLWSEIEAEARDNVTRLMPHPSLVLWNGSNENVWGMTAWGFERRLQGRSWGLGYYQELLPGIVRELDPGRAYSPSSPWSGDLPITPGRDQNDPDHGSMHSWEVWNREDWPRYRDTVPRFMAEFGWQGPPAWATLTRAVHDEPLTPESPGMRVHQKAAGGNDKLTDGLLAHLALPDDMADWHWAMQLNQAWAVRTAVEHLRSWAPRTMGSVVWQLNDCWPVTSWSAVDGDGRAKPLLHALAHAHADRLVTVQPREGGLAAVVVNDTAQPWSGRLEVRRVSFQGAVVDAVDVRVDVRARGVVTVPLAAGLVSPDDPSAELLVASVGDVRGLWFFAEARDQALPPADVETVVEPRPDGADVVVTARALVRDVTLLVDVAHADATVDDALVTLLPGEAVRFRVTVAGGLADPAALVGPRVLRSANDLVAGGRRP